MKLNELLNGTSIDLGFIKEDTEIVSITCDSRRVEPGCLFVCIVGTAVDGHVYAEAAQAAGAAAVVQQLQPRLVIPMHYRGEGFGFENIDTVEPFLARFDAQCVRRSANDTLELTAQTPQGVTVLTFGV